ncbi:magnesium chelatase domain-containing protein [Aquibacillus albus]|uniref:Uncharacterized protein n=1 Tax=Aquibacillus albus TaxID=1168171 RepID=A0ABS2N3I2_9BACI|nr:magnesium chelatase domain-containing protein [Aquibacillus albus]MBM7572656.1 hypothetical protein [Aquibacillus albus]
MTVKVTSIGLKGLEGYRVQVEVRISHDKESVVIVGLPDASVKESRERVLASIAYFDLDVTDKKVPTPSKQQQQWPNHCRVLPKKLTLQRSRNFCSRSFIKR